MAEALKKRVLVETSVCKTHRGVGGISAYSLSFFYTAKYNKPNAMSDTKDFLDPVKKRILILEFIRQKQQVFEKKALPCLSAVTIDGVSLFQLIFGQISQDTTVL